MPKTEIINSLYIENLELDIKNLKYKLKNKSQKLNILYTFNIIFVGIVIAFMATTDACAETSSIDINLTSIHTDTTYDFNTQNLGIGYTKGLNRHWQLQGGYFKNSYNKDSLYAMVNLKHDMKKWQWGIAFGFVTGYDNIEVKNSKNKTMSTVSKEHVKEHDKPKNNYNYKYSPHSHPKNLNAIQFMILPNITWKITKKHRLQFSTMPVATKNIVAFIGVRYQFILGD